MSETDTQTTPEGAPQSGQEPTSGERAKDPTNESPPVAPSQAASDTPGEPEPAADVEDAAPAPGAMLDLSLGPAYWGRRFTEIEWSWPLVVRAAYHLCGHLMVDPALLARPILPGHIAFEGDDRPQIDAVEAGDAGPFLAPEVVAGAAPTEAAAVFNIAALTYYLLVGAPPLGNIGRIDKDAAGTPAALKHVLMKALAVDPRQRTATLVELRTGLFSVLVPPAWYEAYVPRLPVDDDTKARLSDTLNRAQLAWYRLRDRIPWQRVGKARQQLAGKTENPRTGRALTAAGVLLVLLIYIVLFTDVI